MKELKLLCHRSGTIAVEVSAGFVCVEVKKLLEALLDRCIVDDCDYFETLRIILGDNFNLELWQKPISTGNTTAVVLAKKLTSMFGDTTVAVKQNYKVVLCLGEMESLGVQIDVNGYKTAIASIEDEFNQTVSMVEEICDQQGITYIAEMISEKFTSPIPELESAVKKAWKCKSKLHNLKLCEGSISEGYLKSTWNFWGSRTGRITSCKCNIQGLPKKIRETCIVPRDRDHVLIRADYVSQELFLTGIMLQQKDILSKLQSGVDLHREIAAMLFMVQVPDVTAEMRKFAKSVVFAILYGAAVSCVKDIVRKTDYVTVPIAAEEIYCRVKGYFKGIDDVLNVYKHQGYVSLVNGKQVSLVIAGQQYQWLNFVIQSSAAIILKSVMATLFDVMPEGCRILYVVHDEVAVEVPQEKVEEVKKMLETTMAEALFQYGVEIKLPVEITI